MKNVSWHGEHHGEHKDREVDSPDRFTHSSWTHMSERAEQAIRKHPVASITGAVIAGFFVGKMLLSRD